MFLVDFQSLTKNAARCIDCQSLQLTVEKIARMRHTCRSKLSLHWHMPLFFMSQLHHLLFFVLPAGDDVASSRPWDTGDCGV